MTTTILIGPARSGKTELCFRHICEQDPFSEKWVIVPDRIQRRFAVAQLAAAGGALGVEVGTFSLFYQHLLEANDEETLPLTELDVRRMLRALVEGAAAEGRLPHTAAIAAKPGFIDVLRKQIGELLQSHVSPDSFTSMAESAGSTLLQEMSFLFGRYQDMKHEHGCHDVDDAGRIALARLCGQEATDRLACVVVDGFDSFSSLQLDTLRELDRCAGSLWITLPGDDGMQRPALRRFVRARDRLQEVLPHASIQVLPAGINGILAQEVGAQLFEEKTKAIETGSTVVMQEVRSPAQEAREALRWMKALVVRENVPMRACALVVPNLLHYRPGLDSAAAEFGMSLAYQTERTLGDSPLMAALLALCSLPLRNWPRQGLISVLSSPYFDFSCCGLETADAAAFEAVSRYAQIVEGLPEWKNGFKPLLRLRQTGEDTAAWKSLPRGDAARGLREGLLSLAGLLQVPAGERPMADWSEWMLELVSAVRLQDRLLEEGEEEAFAGLEDVLRELAQPVPGVADACTYVRFLEEFQRALETAHWSVTSPWNAISVLQPAQARRGSYAALAVLGLSEGMLPDIEREDPFLPDALRAELGMEPRLGREQRGLFYQVLTRADRFLLVSRPYLSDVGAPWEPSPYWRASAQLFPDATVRVRSETPRPLADAASREERLQWSARLGALPVEDGPELEQSWQAYRQASRILDARARSEPSAYDGWIGDLQSELGERFPPGYVWSASALESYGTCPHLFFVSRLLELEPLVPPEPGFDALQLGNMLHELLECSYRTAAQPEEAASVIEALHQVAEGVFQRAPDKYAFTPNALWPVLQAQWLALLENTIQELQKKQRGWKPLALERAFGMRGEPPLALSIEGRDVLLRGIVDRIDQDEEGHLCVIDYKTGSSALDRRALDEGIKLQLPIYAMAVEGMDVGGVAREGFYWIIPQAKRGSLTLSKYRPDMPELEGDECADAFDAVRVHVTHILSGIQEGRFPPQPPQRGCPSYCPAAGWCWRYTPGRGG